MAESCAGPPPRASPLGGVGQAEREGGVSGVPGPLELRADAVAPSALERRATGGRAMEKEIGKGIANKDVRAANEERDGIKHVGAFKKGGAAFKDAGILNKKAVGDVQVKPVRGKAENYKKGGRTKKQVGGSDGVVSKLDKLVGYKSPAQKLEEGLKDVGKGRTSSYSPEDKSSMEEIVKGRSGSGLPETEEIFESTGRVQGRKAGGSAKRAGRKAGGRAKSKPSIVVKIETGKQAPAMGGVGAEIGRAHV